MHKGNFFDPEALLLAFSLFFLIFVPIERFLPLRPQRFFRKQFLTDIIHFFVSSLLRKFLTIASVVLVIRVLGFLVYPPLQESIRSFHWLAQFGIAFVFQEFFAYWAHRLTHSIPFLWRFHLIHHSSEHLDWLAASRVHPVDQSFMRLVSFLPLYLLGFSKETFGAFIVLEVVFAVFIHSNTRIRFGFLEGVISTPAFHHWHHANDGREFNDKNFAGFLPLFDRLFGTFYLPSKNYPQNYGVSESVPGDYIGQLTYPFVKKRKKSRSRASSL